MSHITRDQATRRIRTGLAFLRAQPHLTGVPRTDSMSGCDPRDSAATAGDSDAPASGASSETGFEEKRTDELSGPARDVVVVDDDVELREALVSRLKEEGYSVASAADGREALDLIA